MYSNGVSTNPRAIPPQNPAATICRSSTPHIRGREGDPSRRSCSTASFTPNCAERINAPPINILKPPRYKPAIPSVRNRSAPTLQEEVALFIWTLVLMVSRGCPTKTDVAPYAKPATKPLTSGIGIGVQALGRLPTKRAGKSSVEAQAFNTHPRHCVEGTQKGWGSSACA